MSDQTPEARKCVERDCDEPAGTRWSPYWCERHDKERRDRITEQMDGLVAAAKEAEREVELRHREATHGDGGFPAKEAERE